MQPSPPSVHQWIHAVNQVLPKRRLFMNVGDAPQNTTKSRTSGVVPLADELWELPSFLRFDALSFGLTYGL